MTTTSDVTFRSDFYVELLDSMGNDTTVCDAARVDGDSAAFWHKTMNGELREKDKGLLNMLLRDRHGVPWEHVVFQFYTEAPVFVHREHMTHRISSNSTESARYKILKPVFYTPPENRPLVQQGKPGAYTFTTGDGSQYLSANHSIDVISRAAYSHYEQMLNDGVAREIARSVLPVNIYTSWITTINLRSLFNYFSLRNKTDETSVPTFPMWEINQVADLMEAEVTKVVPEAMRLFNESGRIAP